MGKASVLTLGQRGPDARQEGPMSTPKPFAQFIAICGGGIGVVRIAQIRCKNLQLLDLLGKNHFTVRE